MVDNKKYEIIDVRVYDPTKSIFKSKASDRAECWIYSCSSKDTCSLYSFGKCVQKDMFNCRCPNGKVSHEYGPTKRARAFRTWISERQTRYAEFLNKLTTTEKLIAKVGDYYYLPYPHMSYESKAPFISNATFMSSGSPFIHEKDFNVKTIEMLLRHRPMAMFGGEITDYRLKEVPLFVKHLKEFFPDIFNEVSKTVNLQSYITSFSNIGRKALLSSLKPGTMLQPKKDKNETWFWDGKFLFSTDAFLGFMPVKFSDHYIKIKPLEKEVITITSEDQVCDGIVFVS